MVDDISQTKPQEPITPKVEDTANILEKAESIAKRIEEANKKSEELVARQEAIAAKMLLSGRAEAGTIQKTPEQTKKEELDKIVKEQLSKYQ